MNKNAKILLGVTGGIAAYKAIDLASHLTKSGYTVRTIMTDHAREFVTPINFSAITHEPVYWNQWDAAEPIAHITLADWADIVVIAPATANIIAKSAHGIADDLLTTTLLAATCPILFIPAMNIHMFENAATQDNISILRDRGSFVLEPDSGNLACGYEGKGRFPAIHEIIYTIDTYLNHGIDLTGKKLLITAGGTIEKIDPMRALTNQSSGKMGLALARAAWLRGAEVTLVNTPLSDPLPYYIRHYDVTSAFEMYEKVMELAIDHDAIIMAAAVADFTVKNPSESKIKKDTDLNINLSRTKDILEELGKRKKSGQILVGFAAETDDLEKNAKDKLRKKNLDLIFANHLNVSGKVDSEGYLITSDSSTFITGSKFQIAHSILDTIVHG